MKITLLMFFILLTTPLALLAQFSYTNNGDGTATITGYSGPGGVLFIPSTISNLAVTGIGQGAFNSVSSLTAVTISDTITNIGDNAFINCFNLGNVTIPGSVLNIGDDAFYDCVGLTNATIASGVTNIGDGAFENTGLFSIIIPSGVNTLGWNAFCSCTNLTNIVIANGVANIDEKAFCACAMSNITIPASVTNIEVQAFYFSTSLTTIAVDPANLFYSSVNGVLFDKSQTTLVQYPPGRDGGSYAIPSGVTTLNLASLAFCYNLTNVTLPGSLISIGNGAFSPTGLSSLIVPASVTNLGWEAFQDCTNLAAVFFEGNAPAEDDSVFNYPYEGVSYPVTVYYLPGATGWSSTFDNVPAVLWNPLIQPNGPNFRIQNNQFGFTITGATNLPVEVEACTNLANPVWIPLQTLTLTNGSASFTDPQ